MPRMPDGAAAPAGKIAGITRSLCNIRHPRLRMKRSSNVSLLVMGTLAFTASFAGGSALLALQKPHQAPVCTRGPDGVETCPPSRWSSGYGRYFNLSTYWDRTPGTPATGPLTQSAARDPALPLPGTSILRGGFGASARAAAVSVGG